LLLLPAAAAAQAAVTETSGDPATIARIRRLYQETEARLDRMRVDSLELEGWSLEGGQLFAYRDGSALRKIVARHYGETYNTREEFYFDSTTPYFVLVVTQQYTEPLSGIVEGTLEHRYYFEGNSLIRRIRHQAPPPDSLDMAFRDPDVAELRREADRLRRCAESDRPAASPCAADE
jgi:hypothetical protein